MKRKRIDEFLGEGDEINEINEINEIFEKRKQELLETPQIKFCILECNDYEYKLVNIFLKEYTFKPQYQKKEDKIVEIIEFSKNITPSAISEDLLRVYCKEILSSSYNQRETIPSFLPYKDLELRDNNKFKLFDTQIVLRNGFKLDLISPRMLFPFARIGKKMTVGNLDTLTKQVYENRKDKNVTKAKIKQQYQEFIRFLDALMQNEVDWKELRGDEFSLTVNTSNK